MEKKDLFKKYHRRIAKEGVVKALLYGIVAGSGVMLLTALLSWFFGFKGGLWLSIALFGVALAATALLVYFIKFRPTTKQIASRVDALGLEERLLTMLELEGDESYIAVRQREDAVKAMKSVDSMLIKVVVSAVLVGAVATALVFGLGGGATVSALYYADVIPSGMELVEGEEKVFTYTVNYGVASGENTGVVILWTEDWTKTGVENPADPLAGLTPFAEPVTVQKGEDAPAVYAVPAAGYVFAGWSDGVMDPYRKDTNVVGSLDIKATFTPIGMDIEDLPFFDNYLSKDGNSDGDGDQQGPSLPNFEQSPTPPQNNDGDGDGGDERTHNNSANQIVDSQHYYGDEFENSYGDALDRLGSDGNLSGDMKDMVSDYYGNISTGSGNSSGSGSSTGGGSDSGSGSGTQPDQGGSD